MEGRTRPDPAESLTAEEREGLMVAGTERQLLLNRLLFAQPTAHFVETRDRYGDLSVIDTVDYLYGLRFGEETVVEVEPGVSLYVQLEAIGDVDDHGMRTVLASLNGQMRPVTVPDRSVEVDIPQAEKANPDDSGQVPAPFAGVISLKVAIGDSIEAGQTVATIEAMKMEAAITASVGGVVDRLAVTPTQAVEAGDLLVVIRAT